MMRTINTSERGIYKIGAKPVAVPANTQVEIIPTQNFNPHFEIAYRYIQNVGASNLYYSLGGKGDTQQFDGILQQYQQLDVSAHRLSVWGYATGDTTVAVTILGRNDLTNQGSAQQPPGN